LDLNTDPLGSAIADARGYTSSLGGSAANIAAALTRQGMRAALMTPVSDDPVGDYVQAELERYGIEPQFVSRVGGEFRNSLALTETRLESHNTVIYRNGAADFQLTVEDAEKPDYSQFGAVIATGTGLAMQPSRDASFRAFELARSAKVPLIFDVDYRPYSWASPEDAAQTYSKAAAMCDIIVGNDVEFGFMAGDYDKGMEKARELANSTASVIIFKMGEKGSVTITRDGEFTTGVFPASPVKPTGAGDSFMGGFVAALAKGHDLQTAVLRGSASAAIVVSKIGCAPAMPSDDELDLFLSEHRFPA
jgi:5-dehydro-2-deoxygluconokinase